MRGQSSLSFPVVFRVNHPWGASKHRETSPADHQEPEQCEFKCKLDPTRLATKVVWKIPALLNYVSKSRPIAEFHGKVSDINQLIVSVMSTHGSCFGIALRTPFPVRSISFLFCDH